MRRHPIINSFFTQTHFVHKKIRDHDLKNQQKISQQNNRVKVRFEILLTYSCIQSLVIADQIVTTTYIYPRQSQKWEHQNIIQNKNYKFPYSSSIRK